MYKIDIDGPITPEIVEDILIASQTNEEIVLKNFLPTSVIAFMKLFLSNMLTISIPDVVQSNSQPQKIQRNAQVITDKGEEKVIENIRETPDGKYYLLSLVDSTAPTMDNNLPVV